MGKIKIHKSSLCSNDDLVNNMFVCLYGCGKEEIARDFTASFYNEFHKKFNHFAELSKDAKNYKYYVNIDKALALNYDEENFLNELEDDVDITFLCNDDFESELTRVMKATNNRVVVNRLKRYYECISKEVAYHAFDVSLEMFVIAEY